MDNLYYEENEPLETWVNTRLKAKVLELKDNDILVIYCNISETRIVSQIKEIYNFIQKIDNEKVKKVVFIPIRCDNGHQNIAITTESIDKLINHLQKIKDEMQHKQ